MTSKITIYVMTFHADTLKKHKPTYRNTALGFCRGGVAGNFVVTGVCRRGGFIVGGLLQQTTSNMQWTRRTTKMDGSGVTTKGIWVFIPPKSAQVNFLWGKKQEAQLSQQYIAGRPCDAKACQGLLKWTWKWQPKLKWPSNVLQGHQKWHQSKAALNVKVRKI